MRILLLPDERLGNSDGIWEIWLRGNGVKRSGIQVTGALSPSVLGSTDATGVLYADGLGIPRPVGDSGILTVSIIIVPRDVRLLASGT